MKRIIDGVTYNTDTATLIANGTWEDQGTTTETALYQSRKGVFFYVDTITTAYRDRDDEIQERVSYEWGAVGDAAAFCERHELTILRDIEDMPPEAELGEKLATLYVRLPPALKGAIETAAAKDKVSANVFALRCLEKCVGVSSGTLSGAIEGQASLKGSLSV